MSRIAVRLILTLLVIAAIVASVISVMKKIPTKQRYPIAQVDQPLFESAATATDVPAGVARNVILILADGMGSSYIEAARLASFGAAGKLEMQKLPVRGMLTTRSLDKLAPDSAAAGTAIATGVRTNDGMIAVDPTGEHLRTILEAAEIAGFVTGLATTTDVSDATPAAFGAHAKSRRERDSIASQLVASDIEILIGSGVKHFVPVTQWGGHRTDGVDLLAGAAASGTTVVRELKDLRGANRLPIIGIFEENDRPPLPDIANESLRLLEASGKPFFLMLESEEVDSAAHDQDLGRTLSAVREVDQTVKAVIEWARRNDSTLVIVTADHDTAGMQILPSVSPRLMQVIWPTTQHTAQDVPLFAFGPGAEAFEGFHDTTYIAPTVARILGIEAELHDH